ncbi:TPA: phage head spike fiber domain-containing protein [Burkholderia contaminans]|uniref:phage head spike fiber domain-containing protein n=2 Tax=Burkholderia contaminans TaxID=488447 RepID=UPI001CF5FD32|nr:phage GP46 family protein [Burkholderia contaminans]MCA7876742.1 phage GP46 family protein [Burkholderia contaminans]MDN8024235.1 phage GP46 family protein [Burkholderia contaminans]
MGDGVTSTFSVTGGSNNVDSVSVAALYRSDWQGNQLLLPTARTNIITQSSAFDNAAWTKNLYAMVAGAIAAPDGTMTGQKLTDSDTSTNVHTLLSPTSAALGVGGVGCASVFLQQGERPYAVLRLQDTSNSGNYCYAVFNLSTGAVLQTNAAGIGTSVSAGIANIGGGWYRCYVSGIPNPSGSGVRMLIGAPLTNTNSTNYTGVAGQGIYVWGAQVESGAVPTSYIRTTSAAVTVTDYAATSSGLVALATPPALGASLTWSGSYYATTLGNGGYLDTGDDLSTAILISLFSDRQAAPDDEIPDGTTNPRGWWGDLDSSTQIGSRLWLLSRAKQTTETLKRANDYIAEALQWLIDDGAVAYFEIFVQWTQAGRLGARVVAHKQNGTTTSVAYQSLWSAIT